MGHEQRNPTRSCIRTGRVADRLCRDGSVRADVGLPLGPAGANRWTVPWILGRTSAAHPSAAARVSAADGGGCGPPAHFHFAKGRVAVNSLATLSDDDLEALWRLAIADALRCPQGVPYAASAPGVVYNEVFKRWVAAAPAGDKRERRRALAYQWLAKIEKNAFRPTPPNLFYALDDHTEILFRKPGAVLRSKSVSMMARTADQATDVLFALNRMAPEMGEAPFTRDQTDTLFQVSESIRRNRRDQIGPAHYDALLQALRRTEDMLRRPF